MVSWSLGTYILFCFSLAVGFYLVGLQTPILYVLGVNGPGPVDPNGNPVYNNMPIDQAGPALRLGQLLTSSTNLGNLLAIIGIAGIATVLSGFGSIYFIPIILYLIFANFLLMPWSMFFTTSSCTGLSATGTYAQCAVAVLPAGELLLLGFNIFSVASFISFVRGGL